MQVLYFFFLSIRLDLRVSLQQEFRKLADSLAKHLLKLNQTMATGFESIIQAISNSSGEGAPNQGQNAPLSRQIGSKLAGLPVRRGADAVAMSVRETMRSFSLVLTHTAGGHP